jgi:hypothetical protein
VAGETHSSSDTSSSGRVAGQPAAADGVAGAAIGCPYQQLFRELLQVGYHITQHGLNLYNVIKSIQHQYYYIKCMTSTTCMAVSNGLQR